MTNLEKTILMLWDKGLSIPNIATELRKGNGMLADDHHLEDTIEDIVTAPGNYSRTLFLQKL